jgi:hypothetical protein
LYWTAAYIALAAIVVVGMFRWRRAVLAELSTPESLAAWREWREDVSQKNSSLGPIERKVPKSEEPPTLVLMRDNFAVSLVGAVFFSSLLYWIIAWFVTGALRSGG